MMKNFQDALGEMHDCDVWIERIPKFINEMKSGRPAYVNKEELDVHHPQALGLPHGAVIAVGTLFFLALAAHYTG